MRKIIILMLFIFFSGLLFAKSDLKINKVKFYGNFVSSSINKKGYYDLNGIKVKLPALIKDWPANDVFDIPPEEIILIGQIQNNNNNIKSERFNIQIRFKISKIVYDGNRELDIEKSEKNKYWDKKTINSSFEVKNIKGNTKQNVELYKFDLTTIHYNYMLEEKYPWLCEITITSEDGVKIVENLEIGLVW